MKIIDGRQYKMENNEIKENLKYLESITKLDDYVDGEKNTKKGIIAYYIVNKIAYRIFHSKEGFMHFRISKDEVCKDEDILYQLYEIEKFFKPNFNVLELGFGQASNLYFLANRNSNVNFTGVDLCPGNKKKIFKNFNLIKLYYNYLYIF